MKCNKVSLASKFPMGCFTFHRVVSACSLTKAKKKHTSHSPTRTSRKSKFEGYSRGLCRGELKTIYASYKICIVIYTRGRRPRVQKLSFPLGERKNRKGDRASSEERQFESAQLSVLGGSSFREPASCFLARGCGRYCTCGWYI